jgi:hypothetical protein
MIYFQTPEARRLESYCEMTLTPQPAKDVRLNDLVPFVRARNGRYARLYEMQATRYR